MAISRKNSRKIVVDEVEYRWAIRHKPTYSQALGDQNILVAIELYNDPQSTLLVHFPWLRNDSWMAIHTQPSVTPKYVEQCIKDAIAQSWNPREKGDVRIEYQPAEFVKMKKV